jgi:hypothetical protein
VCMALFLGFRSDGRDRLLVVDRVRGH